MFVFKPSASEIFWTIAPPPPHFEKTRWFYIFLILHNSAKYYPRKVLLKVTWADFWKLFVSIEDFQKCFFFGKTLVLPPLPGNKAKK